MADYMATLKENLVEQFRGKVRIDSLMEVVGSELQAVFNFYEQLRNERNVNSAIGKQLDGVGDIAGMTRREVGQLIGNVNPIGDDTYRHYLIYKILKNTCNCTYPDIIKAFRMFWTQPMYYSEDQTLPATMIFSFNYSESQSITDLLDAPIIRPGGVGLLLRASLPQKQMKMYTGFAVRNSRHTIDTCSIPKTQEVVFLADEFESLLTDEYENTIVDE